MNSKSLVNCFVWNHQYFEKFAHTRQILRGGAFYHRFMFIAPSSDHSLLTLNLPFKVILRRFEVVFWCLECECCTFQKTRWKLHWHKIHQNIILAFGFIVELLSRQISPNYLRYLKRIEKPIAFGSLFYNTENHPPIFQLQCLWTACNTLLVLNLASIIRVVGHMARMSFSGIT